ncbi:hypothetical protein BG004_005048 [Podila humilis]|nr:hypothetical protein BG004_005048 [Podila humilis]
MLHNIFKKKNTTTTQGIHPIRCSIKVHTEHHTSEHKYMPLLYGSPDIPAKLGATITLEVDEDCKGNDVNIEFKALTTTVIDLNGEGLTKSITTEDPFKINRWKLDVVKPKQGFIAKGVYTRYIEVNLDPLFPSSSAHPKTWVKYSIGVKYTASGRMTEQVVLEQEQEIWVLNAPQKSFGTPTQGACAAKNKSLVVQASIPSSTVEMGQSLPVTLGVSPFMEVSKFAGQDAVVLWATCKVKETRTIRGRGTGSGNGVVDASEILSVPLNVAWPENKDGWEHTVHVTLPSSVSMAAHTATKFLDIATTLSITMKIKARSEKDSQGEECKINVPMTVVAPSLRASTSENDEHLPQYVK